MAAKGDWVEIHRIVLEAADRAPQVPEDTAQVPLEMKVRGFLQAAAGKGEACEIETFTGRRISGKLIDEAPSWNHSFGVPHKEMLSIGPELRTFLGEAEA